MVNGGLPRHWIGALGLTLGCGGPAASAPAPRSAAAPRAQAPLALAAGADAVVWLRPAALDQAFLDSLIDTGDWGQDLALRWVLEGTRVIHVGLYAEPTALVMVFDGRYHDIELDAATACDGTWAGIPCAQHDGSTRIFHADDRIVIVETPGTAPSPPGPECEVRIEDPAPLGVVVRTAGGALALAEWAQSPDSLTGESAERAFESISHIQVRAHPQGGKADVDAELHIASRREAEAAEELFGVMRSFDPTVPSFDIHIEPSGEEWVVRLRARGLPLALPAPAQEPQP